LGKNRCKEEYTTYKQGNNFRHDGKLRIFGKYKMKEIKNVSSLNVYPNKNKDYFME
jgi:hypothetical protein